MVGKKGKKKKTCCVVERKEWEQLIGNHFLIVDKVQ
jgi:hypothetical protein